MPEPHFPPEVPSIDDAVRITPIIDDLPSDYKFFCEESHVTSRLLDMDHTDRKHIEVYLTGERIQRIQFNLEDGAWWTFFAGQRVKVEIEKILD